MGIANASNQRALTRKLIQTMGVVNLSREIYDKHDNISTVLCDKAMIHINEACESIRKATEEQLDVYTKEVESLDFYDLKCFLRTL